MWDIRQITPAEGPEKAVVPLQEARHAMKHFPKRPGTQSPVCVCCRCWIWFFHVFALKAEFLLHQLALYHHLHSQWFQRSSEEVRWAFAASPFLGAGGRVELLQLWGSGCQHHEQSQLPRAMQGAPNSMLLYLGTECVTLAQDMTWMINMVWKVCVHALGFPSSHFGFS